MSASSQSCSVLTPKTASEFSNLENVNSELNEIHLSKGNLIVGLFHEKDQSAQSTTAREQALQSQD